MESGKKIEMWDGSDGLKYWFIGNAWGYKTTEVSYCPKIWGEDTIDIKADLVSIKLRGDGDRVPSLRTIEVRMDFFDDGEILVGAIQRFMEWAGGSEETIKWLEENKENLSKVFEELAWSYRRALEKIRTEIKEREEKINWWFSVKKRPVEEYYNREVTSARNMRNSVYLNDSITEKGSRKLAEEIKRDGKLIDRVVLRNEYDTSHEVLVYEYKGKKWGVEERFFSNGWGMNVDEITVWEILE